ncbi:MAG: hypothetical protein ABW178_05425 [Pseudoxanthomonas sp.]
MDFSNISFNKDHKIQAAAKDAATGLKLIALAASASLVAACLAIIASLLPGQATMLTLIGIALGLFAFCTGAYGAYLAAHALDWPAFVIVAIVLGALIPYLKGICFMVLAVFSIDLIRKAGYVFSFFAPLRKRATAGPTFHPQ